MIQGMDGFQSTDKDYSFSLRDAPKTTTRVCFLPVLGRSSPLVFSNTVSLRDEFNIADFVHLNSALVTSESGSTLGYSPEQFRFGDE